MLATTVLEDAFHGDAALNRTLHFRVMLLLGVAALSAAFTRPTAARILGGNDISYGVYLYQFVVINVVLELGWQPHGYREVLLVIVATVAVAFVSWRLVERPARRLRRWLERTTDRSTTPDDVPPDDVPPDDVPPDVGTAADEPAAPVRHVNGARPARRRPLVAQERTPAGSSSGAVQLASDGP